MSNTLVSIIIPVYNSEAYLAKCLDSITAQTYKDIEVIIVNDGSTDNSGVIADEYHNRDQRIKVYHETNKGASLARKYGCSVANGDFIQFVDSDDWIRPDTIEELLNSALANNSDIVWCDSELVEKSGSHTFHIKYEDNSANMLKSLYWGRVPGWLPNKLIRASLLADVEFPSDMMMEDVYITTQLLHKHIKCSYVAEPLYAYNLTNDHSATQQNKGNEVLIKAMPNIENCYQYLLKENIFSEYEEAFSCLAMRLKIALLKTKGISEAKSVYSFAQKHLNSYGLQPPVAYIYWIGFNWGKLGETLLNIYLKK